MMASRRIWLVTAIALALSVGCGKAPDGPKKVPASGKVTFKNLPVEGATVSFLGDGKIAPAVAITNTAGEFILTTTQSGDGAVPGDHQVTVTKIVGSPAKSTGPTSMEDAAKASGAQEAKHVSMLPEKYASASTSGLQFTVKEGAPNNFSIELKE